MGDAVRAAHQAIGVATVVGSLSSLSTDPNDNIPEWIKSEGRVMFWTQLATTLFWKGRCPITDIEKALDDNKPVDPAWIVQPVATWLALHYLLPYAK